MVGWNSFRGKGKLCLVLVVMIIGGTLLVAGCVANQPEKASEAKTAEMPNETRGNTTGNIVQGGFVAESDGWFYFCMPEDTRLMKMNTDGSDLQILADEEAKYINVIGDWIYYETGGSIVKIRTDGTERTIVDEFAAPLFLNVVDDWIYYYVVLDLVTGSGIYKIRIDGEEKTLLSDMSGYDLNKVGDWIYFSNWDDNRKPYRMNLEGEEVTMLTKDEAFNLHVYRNMVYYTDVMSIYRIGIDGSDRTVLDNSPYVINNFLIDDGWIYFFFPTSTSLNAYNLLKMNPESSEIETLQEIVLPDNRTVVSSFNIAGGWIFFHTISTGEDFETLREALYRVRTDGSGFEMVLEAQY